MGKHVRRAKDALKRIMSMTLVFVMLFLAAAVHIPAETFYAAQDHLKVRFNNANSWSNVYAYVWDDQGSNGWPGVELSATGDDW